MMRIIALASLTVLAACKTGYVPEQPNTTFDLAGNYRAISDCVFPIIGDGTWQMTVLETVKTVRFSADSGGIPVHRVDVIDLDGTRTRVQPYLMHSMYTGKPALLGYVRDIFEKCSAKIASSP